MKKSKGIVDSETWESRVQEMKELQKEWRSVGFVPRKLDNKLWGKFSDIHKVFFDRLKSGYQRLSSEQEAMETEKIAQIEKLKAFTFSSDTEKLKEEYLNFWESGKQSVDLTLEIKKKLISLSQMLCLPESKKLI